MSEWNFLWGLSGQALEDAMSSWTTHEEWRLIEQELDRELIRTNGMHGVWGTASARYYEGIRSRVEWLVDQHQAKVSALWDDHVMICR